MPDTPPLDQADGRGAWQTGPHEPCISGEPTGGPTPRSRAGRAQGYSGTKVLLSFSKRNLKLKTSSFEMSTFSVSSYSAQTKHNRYEHHIQPSGHRLHQIKPHSQAAPPRPPSQTRTSFLTFSQNTVGARILAGWATFS